MNKLIAIGLLITTLMFAQAPGSNKSQILFQTDPPPAVSNITTQVTGSGTQTYYYWVVANYPIGSSFAGGPVQVRNAPDSFSGGNFVTIVWNGLAGVTTYDVLRTATATYPNGVCACAVATGLAITRFVNNTNTINNYTVASAPATNGYMRLDNEDFATPQFVFSPPLSGASLTPTGVIPGIYGNAANVGQFTVDLNGRLTNAINIPIAGIPPSGAASGALGGTYPSPTFADSVYARDFGVKCDSIVDDLANITAALAIGVTRGTVTLPSGICMVSNTVVVPNQVRLLGAGRAITTIKALPAFPVSTPVVALCDAATAVGGLCMSTQVEHLAIDCSGIVGCIGGYNSYAQEQSWFQHVQVGGALGGGFKIETTGGHSPQNSGPYNDLQVQPAPAAAIAATYCFWGKSVPGFRGIYGIACDANGYSVRPTNAILLETMFAGTVSDVNVEHFTNGVALGSVANNSAGITVINVVAGPDVANATRISSSSNNGNAIFNISNSTAVSNLVLDDWNAVTIDNSTNPLVSYITGDSSTPNTGTKINTRSGAENVINGPLVINGVAGFQRAAFAALGTPQLGSLIYCTDCTQTNPCAGAGSGAWALRSAGFVWSCTAGSAPPSAYATVQDEGGALTKRAIINFIGAGVTCVDNAGATRTDCTIPGGGGSAYDTIQDEGGALTQRTIVNFIGAGVTCVDNAGATKTDCTIPGASIPTTVPTWAKYSLVAIANGVNGCANANGCWQVNGVLGANKSAALTQDVVLFQLSAKGAVDHWRITPVTACTGATTAVTGLGTATSNIFYRLSTLDIVPAAGDTNFDGNVSATGSTNKAAVNVVASLVTTVNNIDQLVTGCAVDYELEWAVLP